MRQRPAPRAKPRIARTKTWPAPVRGWIANENIAEPKKGGASVLDNWFPTAETVRMRSGSLKYATIGDGSDAVTAVFSYNSGNNEKLFGAIATDIFDISTIADPDETPTAEVSSLTGGDWVSSQFQTDGGVFLRCVNGMDRSLLYDGTEFSNDDDIFETGDGDEEDISSTFSYVWSWKQRLFFIQKASLDAWYLPVNTIAGAAVKLPLGGVFKRGGSLLFGGTWSQETGDGLNTMCVFVTTEGEVAVYQGSDPSSAEAWLLVGVYRIGRPLGKNAWIQAGGDLVVATDIGFVPLSQATQKDIAALSPGAVSYPIETAWNQRVDNRSFAEWHCEIWPTRQMVMVLPPSDDDNNPELMVANARTGAWARFTGWHATCLEVFKERAFFGSTDGEIYLAETTGSDDGMPYTSTCVLQPNALNDPAATKIALQCRASLLSPDEPNDLVFVRANFSPDLPSVPDATPISVESIWGDAVWGEDLWSLDTIIKRRFSDWQSVSAYGDELAPGVMVTSGSLVPPRVDLYRFDLTYDQADIVT